MPGLVLSVGAALAYLAAVYFLVFRRPGRVRWAALGAFALNCAVGTVLVLAPGGLSDPAGDYVARFLMAVVAAVVTGAAIGYVTLRELRARIVGAAVLGSGAFIGGALFLLVFALSTGDTCLD